MFRSEARMVQHQRIAALFIACWGIGWWLAVGTSVERQCDDLAGELIGAHLMTGALRGASALAFGLPFLVLAIVRRSRALGLAAAVVLFVGTILAYQAMDSWRCSGPF